MIKDHLPDYWLHPYTSEYVCSVISLSANKLTLQDPYPFFIEGGGQPDDKVTALLPGSSDPLPVKPLSLSEISVKLPKSFTSKPPFSITLTLDTAFRLAVMRAHTCQHLLSALLLKQFGSKTLKAVMSDDQGQLFLDKPVSFEHVPSLVSLVNSFIVSNPVPVSSHVLEAGSDHDQNGQVVNLTKIRGTIPQGAPFVRVLSIGSDVDLNTCGGTHISSTDQILSFFISALKKDEIHFICGFKALSFLATFNQQLLTSSSSLQQPFDKTLSFLTVQYDSLQKENFSSFNSTVFLLRSFFDSIYQCSSSLLQTSPVISLSSTLSKDTFTWSAWGSASNLVFLISTTLDKKICSEAIKIFSDFSFPCVVFLLAHNDSTLIFVNQPSKTTYTARQLADICKERFIGKGGGNEFFAQLQIHDLNFLSIEEYIKTLFS